MYLTATKQISIDCGIKQKITWFHVLLASNKIFLFHSYQSAGTFNQQTMVCLEVQTQAYGNSNVCLVMFWKTAVSWPGLMSHQHLKFLLQIL